MRLSASGRVDQARDGRVRQLAACEKHAQVQDVGPTSRVLIRFACKLGQNDRIIVLVPTVLVLLRDFMYCRRNTLHSKIDFFLKKEFAGIAFSSTQQRRTPSNSVEHYPPFETSRLRNMVALNLGMACACKIKRVPCFPRALCFPRSFVVSHVCFL